MNKKKKVKICPSPMCGLVCDQYAMWCANPECKASLRDIPAVDLLDTHQSPLEEKLEHLDNEIIGSSENSSKLVTKSLGARLECIDQPSSFFQIYDGSIAGRAGDIDVSMLRRSNYISRKHVRFVQVEQNWQIENLSRTNPTLVNNVSIPVHGLYKLSGGEVITLADTEFIFKNKADDNGR